MLAPHELLPLERVQALVEHPRTRAGKGRQRVRPEHLPQCSCELQELLLLARKGVDPRSDDALQGLGRGDRRVAAVREHPRVLLCEERIALGPLQERGLLIGREDRRSEQSGKQSRGVLVRQRCERDGRGVALAATPAGSALEQLGARRADDEERNARHPVDESVDEVEQGIVGPVEVLEDEHDGLPLRQRLEEAPPRGEGLVEARLRGRPRLLDTGQREKVPFDPRRLGLVGNEVANGGRDLCPRLVGAVGLENSRLRLQDLRESPERRPLAVRKRATLPPDDELGIVVGDAEELADEA